MIFCSINKLYKIKMTEIFETSTAVEEVKG